MQRELEEVVVDSWRDLDDALFAEAWRASLQRHRSTYAFRGLTNASYPQVSSLIRLGGPYEELERHLLRNFKKYTPPTTYSGGSAWAWLSIAQHHGLPTRLMDWTYSPYVALHFATTTPGEEDAVVWCIDYVKCHSRLPARFQSVLLEEGADVFTVEMLDGISPKVSELAVHSDDPFLLFLEPPSIDGRIVNQFCLFSGMSKATVSVDDWIVRNPDACRKVVIPRGLQWEVRDRLDQANVTERVLFPGLDGLSQWLKRHYSPRVPAPDLTPSDP